MGIDGKLSIPIFMIDEIGAAMPSYDDVENRPKRTYFSREQSHEAKCCRTCDHCSKPSVFQPESWRCKAPQNEVGGIDSVSGEAQYRIILCSDVQYKMADNCHWYQVDPYIKLHGLSTVDRARLNIRSKITIADLKKLTVEDIL